DNYYFISLWELADNLNNVWYAKLFFTKKEIENIFARFRCNEDFGLEQFELYHYLKLYHYAKRLKTTIKKIKGASIIVIPSKSNVWAKIPKKRLNETKKNQKEG
ncbi:MAG: hypothetical protein ACTSUF_02215, partial [Candidatus Heimdallarchaeaceae archaeon]